MKGRTVMEISREEMTAIVEFYLNNNLLNTTFQEHHKSKVVDVKERKVSGRFVIEFEAAKQVKVSLTEIVKPDAEASKGVGV